MADAPLVRLPDRTSSPWRALQWRVVIGVGLLALVVGLVYFDRDGYRDAYGDDQGLSLLDCLYYATVTMTTTGYGDITPVSDGARLFNALAITPLRVMFLIVLVGTTLEVLASQGRYQLRIARWRKRMQDHVVVVGYGTKGRSAAQTLMAKGTHAEQLVVIDNAPDSVNQAQEDGLACVVGDGTRREVLARAGVATASQVLVTAHRDDAAVLITLTARQLNPDAFITVAVREQDNVQLVRQSGADAVVTSSESVGRLIGLSAVSPALGEVLEDILTYGDGLEVAERVVLPSEVGRPPQSCGDQVIAVVRDGQVYRFFEPSVSQLERGDRVVVVRSAEDLPWAPRLTSVTED